MSGTSEPLFALHNVSVRFGFNEALKNVSLELRPHEICAIVGDNGAGKSTLAKILTGYYQPSEGEIYWKDRRVSIPGVKAANSMGIASVFQNPEFCGNLDVSSNLFLGRELSRGVWHGFVRDDPVMYQRSRKVLNSLSSLIRVSASIDELSMGQRQTVAIAQTLLTDPDLLVLDEPTAMLSVIQTAEVLGYMQKLRAEGRSLVFISHSLPDVFAVADRIIVMRRGRVNGDHRVRDTSYEEIIAEIANVAGSEEVVINSEIDRGKQVVSRVRTQHKLIERIMHAD